MTAKKLGGLAPLLLTMLLLAACGQVVTRPAPKHAATRTPTATLAPPVIVPTPTPDNYIPPPTATPTVTPEPIIHSIQAGENLFIIAAQYGVSRDLLREVNGIENERALQVGQKLLIPVAGWGGPAEPTPTVTPTPLPAVVENVYFHPSPLGELTVLGEVRNASASDLERVTVQIALFDDADRLLASQAATIALDALTPGQRSPFAVLFSEAPERYASYEATVLSAVLAYVGTMQRNLAPVDVALEQRDQGLVVLTGTSAQRRALWKRWTWSWSPPCTIHWAGWWARAAWPAIRQPSPLAAAKPVFSLRSFQPALC